MLILVLAMSDNISESASKPAMVQTGGDPVTMTGKVDRKNTNLDPLCRSETPKILKPKLEP